MFTLHGLLKKGSHQQLLFRMLSCRMRCMIVEWAKMVNVFLKGKESASTMTLGNVFV